MRTIALDANRSASGAVFSIAVTFDAYEAVEISEKEFEYLLGKSIVPFKAKKGCDG